MDKMQNTKLKRHSNKKVAQKPRRPGNVNLQSIHGNKFSENVASYIFLRYDFLRQYCYLLSQISSFKYAFFDPFRLHKQFNFTFGTELFEEVLVNVSLNKKNIYIYLRISIIFHTMSLHVQKVYTSPHLIRRILLHFTHTMYEAFILQIFSINNVIVTNDMLGICCETTLKKNTRQPILDIHE